MRIISRKKLREFWEEYEEVEEPLKAWFAETRKVNWETPQDVLNHNRTARILPDNRIIFNIIRNRYRLVVKVNYSRGIVYIRFVGTHAQYDKIDAGKI